MMLFRYLKILSYLSVLQSLVTATRHGLYQRQPLPTPSTAQQRQSTKQEPSLAGPERLQTDYWQNANNPEDRVWYDPSLLKYYSEKELREMSAMEVDDRIEAFNSDRIYVYKRPSGKLVEDPRKRTFKEVYEHRRETRKKHKSRVKKNGNPSSAQSRPRTKDRASTVPTVVPFSDLYDHSLLKDYTEAELMSMYNMQPYQRKSKDRFGVDKVYVTKSKLGKLIPNRNGRTIGQILSVRAQYKSKERQRRRRERLAKKQDLEAILASGNPASTSTPQSEAKLEDQSDDLLGPRPIRPTPLSRRLRDVMNADPWQIAKMKIRKPVTIKELEAGSKQRYSYQAVPNTEGFTNAEIVAWYFYKRKISRPQILQYMAKYGLQRIGLHPYDEGHEDVEKHGLHGLTVLDISRKGKYLCQEPNRRRDRYKEVIRRLDKTATLFEDVWPEETVACEAIKPSDELDDSFNHSETSSRGDDSNLDPISQLGNLNYERWGQCHRARQEPDEHHQCDQVPHPHGLLLADQHPVTSGLPHQTQHLAENTLAAGRHALEKNQASPPPVTHPVEHQQTLSHDSNYYIPHFDDDHFSAGLASPSALHGYEHGSERVSPLPTSSDDPYGFTSDLEHLLHSFPDLHYSSASAQGEQRSPFAHYYPSAHDQQHHRDDVAAHSHIDNPVHPASPPPSTLNVQSPLGSFPSQQSSLAGFDWQMNGSGGSLPMSPAPYPWQ